MTNVMVAWRGTTARGGGNECGIGERKAREGLRAGGDQVSQQWETGRDMGALGAGVNTSKGQEVGKCDPRNDFCGSPHLPSIDCVPGTPESFTVADLILINQTAKRIVLFPFSHEGTGTERFRGLLGGTGMEEIKEGGAEMSGRGV